MIAVRPAVEPRHRVEEMLRALDDRGAAGLLSDVKKSFDAQKARPEVLRNSVQQELRFVARKRGFRASEDEILDSPAFEVRTVRMAAVVIVVVMIMIVAASVMVVRGLMSLKVEPRARIRMRVCRVETGR